MWHIVAHICLVIQKLDGTVSFPSELLLAATLIVAIVLNNIFPNTIVNVTRLERALSGISRLSKGDIITCNLIVWFDRILFIFDIGNKFNLQLTSIEGNESTEVIYGSSHVLDKEILFFANSKVRINTYMDYSRPALALRIEPIKNSFIDARNRGVRLRYITDITAENIGVHRVDGDCRSPTPRWNKG
jgi:hypothetical protein